MKIIDINGVERECESVGPDSKWPGYAAVKFISKRDGHEFTEWYPLEEFIEKNPGLAHLVVNTAAEVKEDLGIVTSGGSNFIRDNTKKWPIDGYVGYPIWISRGKGEGQLRKVVNNTKSMIVVDKKWDVIPNKTSQYVLSYNIHDVKPQGNIIPGVEEKK